MTMTAVDMKPYQDQTYYELLEVPVTASDNEIRSAYERAEELYSPDSVAIYALENPAQADELRARLREAMEILTDADLREEYDRMIGVVRRKGGGEREAEAAPREPSAAAATEVLATPHSVASTHPEFSVSYVPESFKPEPPPPRTGESESAPVRDAMPFVPPPAATPARGIDLRAAIAQRSEAGRAAMTPARGMEPVVPAEEPRAEVRAEASRPAMTPARGAEIAPPPAPLRPAEPARAAEEPRADAARSNELRQSASRAARGLEATQIAEESAIATAEAAMAQVTAKVRGDPKQPKTIDIPPDAEFNGELLRRVRESRGLTLVQVSERTRSSRSHLENVEADRYKDLPAAVYLRGILMNLAREYGLDALRVSKSYLALAGKKS